MMSTAVILTGPTACGKSALAKELAHRFPVEIVNADSLQIFRRLDIGTAKPSPEELRAVPHHLIDVLNPDEEVNAFWYANEALEAIETIWRKKKIPLVVGGSPFYLRALENPPSEEATHKRIQIEDWPAAYEQLVREDPEAARKIHPHDRYRIERALSLLSQGRQPSQVWKTSTDQPPVIEARWLCLNMEREELYARINRRMEKMFSDGLISEAQKVLSEFPSAKSRLEKTIGYKEILAYLDGTFTEGQALEKAKQTTRNYAKRQMTWFRAELRMNWLDPAVALDRACNVLREVMEG